MNTNPPRSPRKRGDGLFITSDNVNLSPSPHAGRAGEGSYFVRSPRLDSRNDRPPSIPPHAGGRVIMRGYWYVTLPVCGEGWGGGDYHGETRNESS